MGFILQDASTGGNSSATAISSATSTNSSAWGTAQNVAFTATGQTLSLPTPISSDIAPILKTIVITNTGTNSFTIALTGGTITSAIGLVMNPGSAWTITAQTLTTANVSATNAAQGVVGEQGTVYASGIITTPTAVQVSAATSVAIPGLTFTAQDTQNYFVSASVRALATNSFICFALFDSLTPTVPVANTEVLGGGSQSAQVQSTGTLLGVFALTAGRTYIIKCWNPSASTGATSSPDGNGRCSLSWQKVTGQTAVTGQSVDYMQVGLSANQTTNLLNNTDHVKFATILSGSGSGIILDSASAYSSAVNVASIGRITLKAGKTYELVGVIHGTSGSTGGQSYAWFNSDTNLIIPGASGDQLFPTYTANVLSNPNATVIFTPSIDTRVELRFTSGIVFTQVDQSFNGANVTYATIKQIGSSATTTTVRAQVRANTMTATASAAPGTAITFTNKELDTTNSFTAATGVFIAPRTGQYQINAQFFVGISNAGSGTKFGVILSTNGGTFGAGSPIISCYVPVTNPSSTTFGGSYVKTLNAGDSLTFRAFLDSATSMSLSGNANFDYITITELNPTF